MACKCIAVLAARPTMGIVIFTARTLVADISVALFGDTFASRTDLCLTARFANAAVDTACRNALFFGALSRQGIYAITRFT